MSRAQSRQIAINGFERNFISRIVSSNSSFSKGKTHLKAFTFYVALLSHYRHSDCFSIGQLGSSRLVGPFDLGPVIVIVTREE